MKDSGSSAWNYVGVLDWCLSATSLVVCLSLSCSLLSNVVAASSSPRSSSVPGGSIGQPDVIVPERYVLSGNLSSGGQKPLQWFLFLKLVLTYFLYDGQSGSNRGDGGGDDDMRRGEKGEDEPGCMSCCGSVGNGDKNETDVCSQAGWFKKTTFAC